MRYEGIFIVGPKLEGEKLDGAIEKIKEVIAKGKGEVEKVEVMGKRELAYPIKKEREGVYLLLNFKTDPKSIVTMNRAYRTSEFLLRHAIFRKEG